METNTRGEKCVVLLWRLSDETPSPARAEYSNMQFPTGRFSFFCLDQNIVHYNYFGVDIAISQLMLGFHTVKSKMNLEIEVTCSCGRTLANTS